MLGHRRYALILALLVSACGEPVAHVPDDSPDAAGEDGSLPLDGSLVIDATTPPDASRADAGEPDSGNPGDASAPPDASELFDASSRDDAAQGVDALIAEPLDAATPQDAATSPDASWPPDAASRADAAQPDAGGGGDIPTRIRIMACNLTSGNLQTYDGVTSQGSAGIRIVQGLQPDIILIQEFNYDPDGDRTFTSEEIRSLVDQMCGTECSYVRGPGSTNSMIPNGIISRWPILSSGQWDDPKITNREFEYAVIDIPGPVDLWAVSIHLPNDENKRPFSATALATALTANVPSDAYLVVGGDLNTLLPLEAAVLSLDPMLEVNILPVDQRGNTGTTRNRNNPYDRVMPNDLFEARRVPVTIGNNQFPKGLVFDSRIYDPLSDVPGVLEDDSIQAYMQHMAVIRDFVVLGP
ncbi:MAG: endonuclease [Deltaproteobacteria bacterium]|nr:endonuclease [Deltaproteobacteria bacterium]